MNELKELESYRYAVKHAQNNLEAFIQRRWPVGSPITWSRHDHLQYGEVVLLSGERIKVRNEMSGKCYWIDIYWVEEGLRTIDRMKIFSGDDSEKVAFPIG